MRQPVDILTKITAHKKRELTQRKVTTPLKALKAACQQAPPVRNFVDAIAQKVKRQQIAIIAEIKQASPSQGIICKDFQPDKIAQAYVKAGASCLSVLTDETFFKGSNQDLITARQACELPVLRKDFIIDSYQLYEARAIGADCILLIVAILTDGELIRLHNLAVELGLSVLIESHNEAELQRALAIKTPLIGINNRNLHTFETDLAITYKLLPFIPNDRMVISESGIQTREAIARLHKHGVHACLIGEALMHNLNHPSALEQFLTF